MKSVLNEMVLNMDDINFDYVYNKVRNMNYYYVRDTVGISNDIKFQLDDDLHEFIVLLEKALRNEKHRINALDFKKKLPYNETLN